MNSLFETLEYRKIIRNWLKMQPRKGRGLLQKMSELLGIPASVFSLILSNQRELSADHAYLLAEYMGLLPLEKDYFITLVQIEKAHHHKYKTFLKEKKETLLKESLNLAKRVAHEKTLNEKDQQEFYSSWLYSAIRLKCSVGEGLSIEAIKTQFHLKHERAIHITEFLLRSSLIVQENMRYKMGPQSTFIGRKSPMVGRHHSNWRLKAIEKSTEVSEKELMFTGPLTCSRKHAEIIREKMAQLLQEVSEIVRDSPAEDLFYVGLDFIRVLEEE